MGLGNGMRNALLRCQVDMLFNKIRQLPGSQSDDLWIDTLCVPINRTFKRIAISKLRNVYPMVSKVLVIDRFLMRVGKNWLGQRLQLLCAGWQHRLWTLKRDALLMTFTFNTVDRPSRYVT